MGPRELVETEQRFLRLLGVGGDGAGKPLGGAGLGEEVRRTKEGSGCVGIEWEWARK